jgi:hypothetical protein
MFTVTLAAPMLGLSRMIVILGKLDEDVEVNVTFLSLNLARTGRSFDFKGFEGSSCAK